jgi:hypothetical protein
MTKEKLISSVLILVITSAAFAQTQRPAPSSETQTVKKVLTPVGINTPLATSAMAGGIASLYTWQIRPNDPDGYFSSDIPQPVCANVAGVGKIFILTNFDFYPSKNFHNYSSAVRVGEITTPADTYQLLSSSASGDVHSLPGKRQEFAATSILRPGDTNHTIYIFGGKTSTGDLDEVYSYTPSGAQMGFKFVTNIPARLGKAGARAGALALPSSNGKIYLFGGAQGGNTVLDQVLEFDPQTEQFTNTTRTMPVAFHGARGMTKAVGPDNFMYLVGARTTAYGAPNYRIYRFHVASGTTVPVMDADNPSAFLEIAPGSGYPMTTWDPSGNVRIIAASGNGSSGPWTWGNIQAWVLKDDYSNPSVALARLSAAPYNNPVRARDMAGAVKCGTSTYLIGGTYGHGTTFQNRGMLVDRLGGAVFGPATSTGVKISTKAF